MLTDGERERGGEGDPGGVPDDSRLPHHPAPRGKLVSEWKVYLSTCCVSYGVHVEDSV